MALPLPEGHDWQEVNIGASLQAFECACGATFVCDLIDGSVEFEDAEHEIYEEVEEAK